MNKFAQKCFVELDIEKLEKRWQCSNKKKIEYVTKQKKRHWFIMIILIFIKTLFNYFKLLLEEFCISLT